MIIFVCLLNYKVMRTIVLISQWLSGHHSPPLYTPRPRSRGLIMVHVKQFTSMASLTHVLVHALLITFVALNMVMTLPVL